MTNPNITLTLSINETQAILGALSKLPFEQVADLWFKVKGTAEQQIAAAQAEAQPDLLAEQQKAGGTD